MASSLRKQSFMATCIAAAGIAVSASSAHADNFVWNSYVYGGQNITLAGGPAGSPGSTTAGAVNATFVSNPLTVFCIQLNQYITPGVLNTDYSAQTLASYGLFNATQKTDITRLFSNWLASATTSVASAAFQLALWEIITETSGSYSATGGTFTGSGNAAVTNQANVYLGALGAIHPNLALTVYASHSSQDFISVSAVPEPSTYAMLLAGLGMLGLITRRRMRS